MNTTTDPGAQYAAGIESFLQQCAIESADAALRRAGLPTYSELTAALQRAADSQPAPLFVSSTIVGDVESIELSTVPGSL